MELDVSKPINNNKIPRGSFFLDYAPNRYGQSDKRPQLQVVQSGERVKTKKKMKWRQSGERSCIRGILPGPQLSRPCRIGGPRIAPIK
jgi:hypothetical protein